jgi:hypothetical protein
LYYTEPTWLGSIMRDGKSNVSSLQMSEFARTVHPIADMEIGTCTTKHVETGCVFKILEYLRTEKVAADRLQSTWTLVAIWRSMTLYAIGRTLIMALARTILFAHTKWTWHVAYVAIVWYGWLISSTVSEMKYGFNVFSDFVRYCAYAEALIYLTVVISALALCVVTSWYTSKHPNVDISKASPLLIFTKFIGVVAFSSISGFFNLATNYFTAALACGLAASCSFTAHIVQGNKYHTESGYDEQDYDREGKDGNRGKNKSRGQRKRFLVKTKNGKTRWMTAQEYQATLAADHGPDSQHIDADTSEEARHAINTGNEVAIPLLTGGLNERGAEAYTSAKLAVAQFLIERRPGAALALTHRSISAPVVAGNKHDGSTVKTQNADVVPKDTPTPNIPKENAKTAELISKVAPPENYEREQLLKENAELKRKLVNDTAEMKRQLDRKEEELERKLNESVKIGNSCAQCKERKPTPGHKICTPCYKANLRRSPKGKSPTTKDTHSKESLVCQRESCSIANAPLIAGIPVPDGTGNLRWMQACLHGVIIPSVTSKLLAFHVPAHKEDQAEVPYLVSATEKSVVPVGTEAVFSFGSTRVTMTLRNVIHSRGNKYHAYLCCEVTNDVWELYKNDFEVSRTGAASATPEVGAEVAVITRTVGGTVTTQYGMIDTVNAGSFTHNAPVVFDHARTGREGEGASGSTVHPKTNGRYRFYGYHDGGIRNKHNVAVAAEPFQVELKHY